MSPSPKFNSGYITVNHDWLITSCNSKGAAYLGLSEEFLIGKDCREIFCSDQQFREVCIHLQRLANQRISDSIQLNLSSSKGPNSAPVNVQLVTIPDQNSTILGAFISFSDDNTTLAASKLALNSIAEGVFTVDHDLKITSFNAAAERITGWKEEEVIGKPCKIIFHSSICKNDCALARSIQASSAIHKRKVYITHRDGHPVPVQIHAAPLIDPDNQIIGGVETFRDISATLQHEIILDAVADGVFTVNANAEITSFNRAAEKITGYKEEEVLGKVCADVLLSGSMFERCTLTRCMHNRETVIDQEFFVQGKDGYSIPVSVSAAPFLDPSGKVVGAVESFRDNTSRLQTALILDSVADGVFTVDRNWRITSFNTAAELITGWSKEDALGQYCSDVFHSSICGKNCAIAESLYTGKPVSSRSITIQDYHGGCCSVSICAAPLVDHEGNVVGGVETFRDLSVEISLRQQLMKNFTFDAIISKSSSMQRLFQILPDISQSESNVLILGESGTGKELIARAIYNASSRSEEPFIAVNCGALPETLLESELFGYKAGAFTDARKDREGRFAAAEGGTIFLDEIGDIPQTVQVKLLRVLQERTYEPLGSNSPVKANVRILAATNKDLSQLVEEREFRDDLYYRLNVVNIKLPPLRERIEDIPLLIEHFVDKFRAEKQKDINGITDEVMSILMRYSFPGNIRELENIIEYAFIICPGGHIQKEHLPENVSPNGQNAGGLALATRQGMSLQEIEKQAILLSLERNGWKKMKTCRELGISKDTLRRKLKSYELES